MPQASRIASLGAAKAPGFGDVHDAVAARAALRAWMFGQALPFWGGPGMDRATGAAQESMRLDGTPAGLPWTRMRVQARQLYAFSHAALLGWQPGAALADGIYRFITQHGERDDGGWVRRLALDGSVLDPAADLYDQAFVLFALAWHARLTREAEPLARARRTLEWIGAHMAHPPAGLRNVLPHEAGPRQQNPHMHLLEAALALLETTGDGFYAEQAHGLASLFHRHLFDPTTGTLGEFFTDEWAPAPGEAGSHVEPGHHYEWVWLLDQYERLTGRDASASIDRLYDFARRRGTDPGTALVWDAVGRDGAVRQSTTRLWPQTEALKAHIVMARRCGGGAELIAPVVHNIGTRFLAGCPEGAWIDQLDAAGEAASKAVPTSSFYHLFMAFAELDGMAPSASAEPPLG